MKSPLLPRLLCLALGCATALAPAAARAQARPLPQQGRVVRDHYGVPHIFAPNRAALFELYGFTVAEDRLWQLEMGRRAARGQLAVVFGENFVKLDRFIRATGYDSAALRTQLATLSPSVRADLRAYTAGINRYLRTATSLDTPLELILLGLQPEPWQEEDSLALAVFMLRRFGEIGGHEVENQQLLQRLIAQHGAPDAERIFDDLMWRNDPEAPVTMGTPHAPAARTEALRTRIEARRGTPQRQQQLGLRLPATIADQDFLLSPPGYDNVGRAIAAHPRAVAPASLAALQPPPDAAALWQSIGVASRLGSYAWAVSPQRSADHVAMLYGGPQMGASVPEIVHEVQLSSDDGLHVVGMAIAGVPYVLIGHNRTLGWTSTTAVGDNMDIFVTAPCQAGARQGIVWQGACEPVQRTVESIPVAGAEPVLSEQFRHRLGPVLLDPKNQVALLQRRAHWQREVEGLQAFSDFNAAENLDDFAAALGHVVTQHNFIYADRAGNIAYWQAGLVPERAPGFDFRLPLPGTQEADWFTQGLPMPASINPADGVLANWNSKPSATYDNADNRFLGKQFRQSDLLARLQSPRAAAQAANISWQDMHDIAADIARIDVQGRKNRHLQQHLLTTLGPAHYRPSDVLLQQAQEALLTWTGEGVDDARTSAVIAPAHALFDLWLSNMQVHLFDPILGADRRYASLSLLIRIFDHTFGEGSGHGLPLFYDYLQGRGAPYLRRVARTAFEEAVATLGREHGSAGLQTWRIKRPQVTLAHPIFGPVGQFPLANRATYAQILRFDPVGVRGVNIFTLGQSGQVTLGHDGMPMFAPHFADLLPLYRNFEYKPMLLLGSDCLP